MLFKGLFQGGNDHGAHYLAHDFVACQIEAVAKFHVRHDAGGFRGSGREHVGGDGQIRCTAANVYGGYTHRGHGLVTSLHLALFAKEIEVLACVAHMLDHDFVVEQHKLGAARLVPFADNLGRRLVVEVVGAPFPCRIPAKACPDRVDSKVDPALKDAPGGYGHGSGHSVDDAAQMARLVREQPLVAACRGIDVDECLGQDLRSHEHHERGSGKIGSKEGIGLLLTQGRRREVAAQLVVPETGKGGSFLVELAREKAAGDHGFGVGAGVVAPALRPAPLVPEVTLGAGHARIALCTGGVGREAHGLGANAHAGGPGKGRGPAAGPAREHVAAKAHVHEFHPGLEGIRGDVVGIAQIAQLKQVAVVQIGLLVGRSFDKNACCAGISDVQDKVHVYGVGSVGVGHLHVHVVHGPSRCVEPGHVGGNVFQVELFPVVVLETPQFSLVGRVELQEPLVHPLLVHKPAVVTHLPGKEKFRGRVQIVP